MSVGLLTRAASAATVVLPVTAAGTIWCVVVDGGRVVEVGEDADADADERRATTTTAADQDPAALAPLVRPLDLGRR